MNLKTDFNIYHEGGNFRIIFDENDPQAYEIFDNLSDLFNAYDRSTEADKCRNEANNLQVLEEEDD